jgi:hypothetical protein
VQIQSAIASARHFIFSPGKARASSAAIFMRQISRPAQSQ